MDVISIIKQINGVLWGPVMLFLLLGTGILYTIKLRFLQIRRLKNIFKQTFGGIFKKIIKIRMVFLPSSSCYSSSSSGRYRQLSRCSYGYSCRRSRCSVLDVG